MGTLCDITESRTVKAVGEPDNRNGYVRFDEGVLEIGVTVFPKRARKGKPWIRTREDLRQPRQCSTLLVFRQRQGLLQSNSSQDLTEPAPALRAEPYIAKQSEHTFSTLPEGKLL